MSKMKTDKQKMHNLYLKFYYKYLQPPQYFNNIYKCVKILSTQEEFMILSILYLKTSSSESLLCKKKNYIIPITSSPASILHPNKPMVTSNLNLTIHNSNSALNNSTTNIYYPFEKKKTKPTVKSFFIHRNKRIKSTQKSITKPMCQLTSQKKPKSIF